MELLKNIFFWCLTVAVERGSSRQLWMGGEGKGVWWGESGRWKGVGQGEGQGEERISCQRSRSSDDDDA